MAKDNLYSCMSELKKEISTLKSKLNKLHSEKEHWFSEYKKLSTEIRAMIASVKEKRRLRDELTDKVRELKGNRTQLNKDIKDRRIKIPKNEISKKIHLTYESLPKLKKEAKSIELKLETEVMPFEKEKELAKRSKKLKRDIEDLSIARLQNEAERKAKSFVRELRSKSDDVHNKLQKNAGESQKIHESLIGEAEIIDKKKDLEKDARGKFLGLKKIFHENSLELKKKLQEMTDLKFRIDKLKSDNDQKRKIAQMEIIKNKEVELEDKIKSGKKLTTEDLLVFRNQENIGED